MAEIPENWRDIIRQNRMNISVQNVSLTESTEENAQESLITEANQNINDKIEITSLMKIIQDEEYLNRCHNYVFNVQVKAYLLKVGLYLYIDKLQIGYDTKTKEITLPLDGVKGSRYFTIRLEFDNASNEVAEQKVLQYYNLKPNETAKWNLYKDADGKLINGGKNYDNPYNDLGKKALFENDSTQGSDEVGSSI